MSLRDWQKNSWLVEHKSSPEEIAALLDHNPDPICLFQGSARISAFAQVLDVTLPTTQAKFDTASRPGRYYFHIEFSAQSVSLEYDSADGMLTVLLDGFSAKAPPGFDAVVASLR